MPPMPPREPEVRQRGLAVRDVIKYIRANPKPIVALAPEGRDILTGQLGWPPAGAGRFILRINQLGLPITPVGVYEQDGRLVVHFGPAYQLPNPEKSGAKEIDQKVAWLVMLNIARLLPAPMRGEFDG